MPWKTGKNDLIPLCAMCSRIARCSPSPTHASYGQLQSLGQPRCTCSTNAPKLHISLLFRLRESGQKSFTILWSWFVFHILCFSKVIVLGGYRMKGAYYSLTKAQSNADISFILQPATPLYFCKQSRYLEWSLDLPQLWCIQYMYTVFIYFFKNNETSCRGDVM